jgi:hypothetical protein
MNKSENISKLTEALAKVQGSLEGALTDSNNPYFKSKYADLTSVWRACRKQLSDNGLAIIQVTVPSEDLEYISLETILSHVSGEWVSSMLRMKPVKNDPQAIGSCITYMRRYSLAAIVGVSPEDDDGNNASILQGNQVNKSNKSQVDSIKDILEPKQESTPIDMKSDSLINKVQAEDIVLQMKQRGIDGKAFMANFGIKKLSEIKESDLNLVYDYILSAGKE